MSASLNPIPSPVPPPGETSPHLAPIRPKNRSLWRWGLVLVIVATVSAAYQLWPKPQERTQTGPPGGVRTAKAAIGILVREVRVAGQTSARNYALITVPLFRGPDSRGSLTLLKLAKGGSMVKKGETVAQIDAQAAQDHIDDADDSVEQAESDIGKRKAEQSVDWDKLQQTLRVATADRDKARLDDTAAEVKTDIERELLRLNAEEAEARHKQMEGDVDTTKAGDRAEIRILEITLKKQQIHRDRHVSDIQKFNMLAPMAGLVVMQQIFRGAEMGQIQEGDQISPGQQIMKIVDPFSMQVEGSVNQSESSEFRIGQPATVGMDAFPDLRFKGRVYSIGALAISGRRENFYIRNVPVRIAIEGHDPRCIPDLSAWANVVVERRENALLIPREAVQSDAGKIVVYVKRPGALEKRDVELGSRNETHAVVLSGLSVGEEVVLGSLK